MKGFLAFTKKEFMEQIRTYRLLIMFSVFFLFGMMGPLMAKIMPEIIADMEIQGITLIFSEPTAMDAYSQFFQNINEMGIIVIVLVFGGVISNELTRGTLINILAKGLPRHSVILSKYVASLVLWTVSYLVSALTNYGYTAYLFENSTVENLFFSLLCLWLFGGFVLSLIFLSSALTGGNFGGLILTAIALGSLLLINIFPWAQKFNPVYLSSHNLELLSGTLSPSEVIQPLVITILLIVVCLYASILLFRKKIL